MLSMIRTVLLLLMAAGCATPSLHPRQIEVTEIDWGVYREVDGKTVLVAQTDQIPCRADAKFGARLKISVPGDRTAIVPLKIRISEPEIQDVRPATETGPEGPFVMPKGLSSFELAMFDKFKGEFDLVDGTYVVAAIHPETGLSYYARVFYLRDCENASPHNKILHQTNI